MPFELAEHPLFEGVAEPVRSALTASARQTPMSRGDILARPGTARHDLLLILDGYVHSYDLTDDGGRALFEVVGPGGFDAAIGALGGSAHFTEAVSSGQVASIPESALDRAMARDHRLTMNLVHALAERVSQREQQLAATALKDPSKQIAKQLLAIGEKLADRRGDHSQLRLHVTHQQIADMLGIRRETVTIHLHLLARAGAVALDPRGLRVRRSRLEAILDDRLRVGPPARTRRAAS